MSNRVSAPGNGIGRPSSPAAERVSADLRMGQGDALRRRRRVAAMALSSAGSMGVVAAYQMGLIKHLPEPRLAVLDADKVDASGEAYQYLKTPDAALGLANSAITLVLAGMGQPAGRRSGRGSPWLWQPRSASIPCRPCTSPWSRVPNTAASARGACWRQHSAWRWCPKSYPRPAPPGTRSAATSPD